MYFLIFPWLGKEVINGLSYIVVSCWKYLLENFTSQNISNIELLQFLGEIETIPFVLVVEAYKVDSKLGLRTPLKVFVNDLP